MTTFSSIPRLAVPAAATPAPTVPPAASGSATTAPPTAKTPPASTPATNAKVPILGHDPVKQWPTPPAYSLTPNTNYAADLATTDGHIGVQLLPGIAPNAVNNFVFLANQGFYKNVPIHRMIPGFMLQSGDPTGTGVGGPGYDLPDDKVPDGLSYGKGIVAMANTGQPNSGGSQFFVMLGNTPLPPTYSIFGYVTKGYDVLDKINAEPVVDNGMGEQSKPAAPIGIENVTISESPAAPLVPPTPTATPAPTPTA